MASIESENPEYVLSQLIENISREIPPKSSNYVRVCFLLSAILPSNSVLNGKNLISRIYNETLKDKEGGLERFWFVLNETDVCPTGWLADLHKSVAKTYFIPDSLTPTIHLRAMILKIVAGIATDEFKANRIINSAGGTFNPRTTRSTLPDPKDNDYTVPLLRLFERAEEQLKVEPTELGNLRKWLDDAGCQKLIKDHLDTFDPKKKIRILSK